MRLHRSFGPACVHGTASVQNALRTGDARVSEHDVLDVIPNYLMIWFTGCMLKHAVITRATACCLDEAQKLATFNTRLLTVI